MHRDTASIKMNVSIPADVAQYLALVAYLRVLLQPQPPPLPIAYQTVFIFYDPFCKAFDPIVRSVQSDSHIPTKVYSMVAAYQPLVKRLYNSKHLYVFLFATSANFAYIDQVIPYLPSSGHPLVLVLDGNESDRLVGARALGHLSIMQRYLLVSANGLVLWQTNEMLQMSVDLFDADAVRTMMRRVYAASVEDLAHWNATVYIHYYPPFSMLSPIFDEEQNIELIGTDALMAYDIVRRLNATAVICTDVQAVHSDFRDWYNSSSESPYDKDLSSRYFAPRVILWRPTYVFDFNA